MKTRCIPLWLEPLDLLFFRDARPFSPATRARSGLPFPQTFFGAVTTAILRATGCRFAALSSSVRSGKSFSEALLAAGVPQWAAQVETRGPWLARRKVGSSICVDDVFIPNPAIVQRTKDQAKRITVATPGRGSFPGWESADIAGVSQRPLRINEQCAVEHAEGFLASGSIRALLQGDCTNLAIVDKEILFNYESRTGIGIDADRLTTREGMLYMASFLALKPQIGFYAEVMLPEESDFAVLEHIGTLPFGGEGKRVRVTQLQKSFDWPKVVPTKAGEKPLCVLTSPAFFSQEAAVAVPKAFRDQLVSMASPVEIAVSGWDLAKGGPKATRFGVAAGTTYFLESAAVPCDNVSPCDEDRRQGWGTCLWGVWKDA